MLSIVNKSQQDSPYKSTQQHIPRSVEWVTLLPGPTGTRENNNKKTPLKDTTAITENLDYLYC